MRDAKPNRHAVGAEFANRQNRRRGPKATPRVAAILRERPDQREGRGAEPLLAMRQHRAGGMTLVELIVAISILLVLTTMALPLARVTIQRDREHQLQAALTEIRSAIDRYKDAADRGAIQVQTDSQGYPPDLDTLVNGVPMGTEKIHFLRKIPMDPMTHSYDWGMRSVQDEPDSQDWGGQDVFNVYTTSTSTALNGTKYNTW